MQFRSNLLLHCHKLNSAMLLQRCCFCPHLLVLFEHLFLQSFHENIQLDIR